MLEANGKQISDEINTELSNLTSKHVKTQSNEIIHNNVTTVLQEIKTGMMNLINRNVSSNALADIYKNITNQCVTDVVNGGKTLERRLMTIFINKSPKEFQRLSQSAWCGIVA